VCSGDPWNDSLWFVYVQAGELRPQLPQLMIACELK
jgi:hypothetical protein